jgi:hypothetical protein
MKKTFLAVVMLTGFHSAAHADYQSFMQQPEQPYVGIDYQATQIDAATKVNLGSIMLRAGTQIAPYIGVEAQFSYGIQDDDFSAAGNTYTAKNHGSYGLFIRPSLQLANNLTAYGLLGANYADIKVDGPNYTQNSYGTSFAAGAGLTLMTSKTIGFGAEYMHYDTDIDAVSLGLHFMF